MCLFSQPVEKVSGTSIFARVVGGEPGALPRQLLVYSMSFSAGSDLAMILPLPTPKDSPEDSVTFINLEDYAEFFEDMRLGFPGEQPLAQGDSNSRSAEAATLKVHDVGAFEASFVPKRADFQRLDPRFSLPEGVWEKLPCPEDYGFAVFKLKAGKDQHVHPLALSFPTRNFQQIFFPTAHLHGAEWEKRASFDHALYFQGSDQMRLPLSFDTGTHRLGRLVGGVLGVAGGAKAPEASPGFAKDFMKLSEERGLLDGSLRVFRFQLHEQLPNRDVVLWPRYHDRAGEYP